MQWIIALHLIFVVTWFAGMFYLPRLYVYHAQASDSISIDRFKVMERKLFWGIMTPSALLATGFGFWLLAANWVLYSHQQWLHLKLLFVVLLWGFHVYCWWLLTRFKCDRNSHSHVFYRWVNEIPVVFLVVIIILAIVKPQFG